MANATKSENRRLYYGCQAIRMYAAAGQGTSTGTDIGFGLLSLGMNTNLNPNRLYQMGQRGVGAVTYDNAEIELSLERYIFKSDFLLADLATASAWEAGAYSGSKPVTIEKILHECDIAMLLFNSDKTNASTAYTTDLANCTEIYMSGMQIQSVSFNFNPEGPMTETCTLVGQHREWHPSGDGFRKILNSTGLPTGGTVGGCQELARREDFTLTSLPHPIGGGKYAEGADDFGKNRISNISINADFAGEDIFTLGQRKPFLRGGAPFEVTVDIDVILNNKGDATPTSSGASCPYDEPIVNQTLGFSVGANSWSCGNMILNSISYAGGDAGGGNMIATYSYSTMDSFEFGGSSAPLGVT